MKSTLCTCDKCKTQKYEAGSYSTPVGWREITVNWAYNQSTKLLLCEDCLIAAGLPEVFRKPSHTSGEQSLETRLLAVMTEIAEASR